MNTCLDFTGVVVTKEIIKNCFVPHNLKDNKKLYYIQHNGLVMRPGHDYVIDNKNIYFPENIIKLFEVGDILNIEIEKD